MLSELAPKTDWPARAGSNDRLKLLLVSIVPPQNDCGVRIVMHRHLVERRPFELHVATTYESCNPDIPCTHLTLPYPMARLRKTRFGPRLRRWFADYENFIMPAVGSRRLDRCITRFRPDVILTLAETGLCHLAQRAARKHGIPLATLFLDWFPIMEPHFGHFVAREILSQRYRLLYRKCDLAFCTSDGMQEVLGPHPNSHVIYPMPGRHLEPEKIFPPRTDKFRLAYVGSVAKFYGRMICSMIERFEQMPDLEMVVVGPNADWPPSLVQRTRANGTYLGFRPPEEAAEVLAGADALLVVMSFEEQHKLFMQTSFTTKLLDYVAFRKPIILWGPDYCTPVRVVRKHGGAVVVDDPRPEGIVDVCRQLASDGSMYRTYSDQATQMHRTLFNPDRLQSVFVERIEELAVSSRLGKKVNADIR